MIKIYKRIFALNINVIAIKLLRFAEWFSPGVGAEFIEDFVKSYVSVMEENNK